jgi:hypothetical protein
MRHGDYYDAPLGMLNAIKGKKPYQYLILQ